MKYPFPPIATSLINDFCYVALPFVGPLVSRSVGRSVGQILLFYVFYFLASLLLPKWSSDLKHGSCPPACHWGSHVSGLVFLLTCCKLFALSQPNRWWIWVIYEPSILQASRFFLSAEKQILNCNTADPKSKYPPSHSMAAWCLSCLPRSKMLLEVTKQWTSSHPDMSPVTSSCLYVKKNLMELFQS